MEDFSCIQPQALLPIGNNYLIELDFYLKGNPCTGSFAGFG